MRLGSQLESGISNLLIPASVKMLKVDMNDIDVSFFGQPDCIEGLDIGQSCH